MPHVPAGRAVLGQAADRAAVAALVLQDQIANPRAQGEDALDRVRDVVPSRRQQNPVDAAVVEIQDSEQHVLLAGEEM